MIDNYKNNLSVTNFNWLKAVFLNPQRIEFNGVFLWVSMEDNNGAITFKVGDGKYFSLDKKKRNIVGYSYTPQEAQEILNQIFKQI